MMFIARRRARRGAALLDQKRPDWDATVNMTTLNLSDGRACVLGQAYRPENTVRNTLCGFSIGKVELGLSTHAAIKHGFVHGLFANYHDLDKAWLEILTERREKRRLAHQAEVIARRAATAAQVARVTAQQEAYATYGDNIVYAEMAEAVNEVTVDIEDPVSYRDPIFARLDEILAEPEPEEVR